MKRVIREHKGTLLFQPFHPVLESWNLVMYLVFFQTKRDLSICTIGQWWQKFPTTYLKHWFTMQTLMNGFPTCAIVLLKKKEKVSEYYLLINILFTNIQSNIWWHCLGSAKPFYGITLTYKARRLLIFLKLNRCFVESRSKIFPEILFLLWHNS